MFSLSQSVSFTAARLRRRRGATVHVISSILFGLPVEDSVGDIYQERSYR